MEHEKTIFITGASSGIGKEAAKLFHRNKWNVIATMRNPDKEAELKQFDNVLVVKLDVTDDALVKSAVAAGLERFGRIDALLNNAGFGIYGPLEVTPIEKIRQQFETNVIGLLRTTKGLLPVFRAQRAGLHPQCLLHWRDHHISAGYPLPRQQVRGRRSH